MKPYLTIALFFLIGLLTADNLYAQQQTVSLTSGGSPTVSGYGALTPASFTTPRGVKLDAAVNFGDVSPDASRLIQIVVPIRISASGNYKVELQRSPMIGDGISPEKIGFSVQNVRAQVGNSSKLNPDALNGAIIQKRFGAESAVMFKRGRPQFQTTLADISESPTTILTGVATLANGKLGEDENSILFNLKFTIAPQYYTPTNSFNLPLIIIITPML